MVLSPVNVALIAGRRVLPLSELKTKLTPQNNSSQPEAVSPPLLGTLWSIKPSIWHFKVSICVSV